MSQLNEISTAFDDFWLQHQKKLELSLELCQFEHNFQQVTHFTIDSKSYIKSIINRDNVSIIIFITSQVSTELELVTDRVAAFSHVGMSQTHTEHLLRELTDQEDQASVSLIHICSSTVGLYTTTKIFISTIMILFLPSVIIYPSYSSMQEILDRMEAVVAEGQRFIRSSDNSDDDDVKMKCAELQNNKEKLLEKLKTKKGWLLHAIELHRKLQSVRKHTPTQHLP